MLEVIYVLRVENKEAVVTVKIGDVLKVILVKKD